MAIDVNAFSAAVLNWSSRATTRWASSIDAIRNKQYTYADMMADSVAATIDDPVDFWTDLLRNAGIIQSSIFIPIATNTATYKSEKLVVPTPADTKITSLVLVGGSGKEKITEPDNLRLDPVDTDGVQVVLRKLSGKGKITPPLKAGQYLGVIYEDKALLAHVVVHVS